MGVRRLDQKRAAGGCPRVAYSNTLLLSKKCVLGIFWILAVMAADAVHPKWDMV